jgi:hypothetical protein
MQHRLTFTTNELLVIRESVHAITIKGVDAPVVAGVLDKVYKGIEKAATATEQSKTDEKPKS